MTNTDSNDNKSPILTDKKIEKMAKQILSEHDIAIKNVRYAGILASVIEIGKAVRHVFQR